MPTYDYICQSCHKECEIFHKISDNSPKSCPSCQKITLQRKFSGNAAGLAFQGSGYYITDHDPKRQSAQADASKCCPCGKDTGSCSSS